MTSLLAAFALMGHQGLSSSEILSKVLAKYAAANSATGEFTMAQSVGNKKIAIKTELQFVRPSKIYLHQSSEAVAPNDWLLVSDGVNFGYDAPGATQRKRLFEQVAITESTTGAKKVLKIHSIYQASKRSLGDTLNPFVEFVTQSEGDNASVKGFLTRMFKMNNPTDKTLPDGTTAYSISGIMGFGDRILNGDGTPQIDKTTGYPIFESAGRFEMVISKDFDLISMRNVDNIQMTDAGTNLPTNVAVITTWTGKFNLNATPDDAIFKVR